MPKCPPQVYLIRHGETAWSLTGQHTGRTDILLNDQGEQDARRLGKRLQGILFSYALTSPLRRAQQTCELAGLAGISSTDADLMEWDYGGYEGRRPADIRMGRPDWNIFRDGCPRGESPAQACVRADRLIVRLRTLEGNIALFTHGHFGRVLAARWIGLQVTEARHFLLATASLSLLGFEHDDAEAPAIAMWNSAADESSPVQARETP